MKNIIKIATILLFIFLILCKINITYASKEAVEMETSRKSTTSSDATTETSSLKEFNPSNLNKEIKNPSDNPSTGFAKFAGIALSVIQVVGVILTVVLIGIIGFKYMFGGIAEKADIVSSFGGILVGIIFLTGAVSIVRLFVKI